jgi:Ca2+-transporting ATPase
MSDADFAAVVDLVTVYARATPKHKLRIVTALQTKGHIVAMTGDGVNDAPALKKSDIGVAMGKRGTQVAREASDMILTDDNFSSIVRGIEQGRTIYSNIRKFVYYLLSISIAQVLLVFMAMILGFPAPLTAIMVIFINLITSDLGSIALTYEKTSPAIMKRMPRDPKESILNAELFLSICQIIPIMLFATMSLFVWKLYVVGTSLIYAQTFAFAAITVMSLFHTYNSRSMHTSIFKNQHTNWLLHIGNALSVIGLLVVIYIPGLQSLFGTVPLLLLDWVLILAGSVVILLYIELQKAFMVAEARSRESHAVRIVKA